MIVLAVMGAGGMLPARMQLRFDTVLNRVAGPSFFLETRIESARNTVLPSDRGAAAADLFDLELMRTAILAARKRGETYAYVNIAPPNGSWMELEESITAPIYGGMPSSVAYWDAFAERIGERLGFGFRISRILPSTDDQHASVSASW